MWACPTIGLASPALFDWIARRLATLRDDVQSLTGCKSGQDTFEGRHLRGPADVVWAFATAIHVSTALFKGIAKAQDCRGCKPHQNIPICGTSAYSASICRSEAMYHQHSLLQIAETKQIQHSLMGLQMWSGEGISSYRSLPTPCRQLPQSAMHRQHS